MKIMPPRFDCIEVEISDFYAPMLVDLHQFFGNTSRCLDADLDTPGVAKVDSISRDGILFLTADASADSGARALARVRAEDSLGNVTVAYFTVVAVDLLKTVIPELA